MALVGIVVPDFWSLFVLGPVILVGLVLVAHSYWTYRGLESGV